MSMYLIREKLLMNEEVRKRQMKENVLLNFL